MTLVGNWRSLLGGSVGAEAVGEPNDGGEHAEVAEDTYGGANFLVLGEKAPLGEEDGPVALVGAYK